MIHNNEQNQEDGDDDDDDDDDQDHEFLFGFGSIMNTSTHASWFPSNPNGNGNTPGITSLPGTIATLSKEFGYERRWNFRSNTGFTALGVTTSGQGQEINGVLFRVPRWMMPGFDRREVGYTKLAIPLEYLILDDSHPKCTRFENLSPQKSKIWWYVPDRCRSADEAHPLLQSYVDTVLQGCLEWGGEDMASRFIQTTGGWSPFFLNDTPSSRRPWLFRNQYDKIDKLLEQHSSTTYFYERKHPEEFASSFHRTFKGTWSVPKRNPNFTGRDHELDRLHQLFFGKTSSGKNLLQQVEVVGMGGVGKTQLVTEYCYRNYPSNYGLIIWWNAESDDSLVADYQQLLQDLTEDNTKTTATNNNNNNSSIEIINRVKTRLFRSSIPWLLVFDNLEDYQLLSKFLPRGAGQLGHVLITTRHHPFPSESSPLVEHYYQSSPSSSSSSSILSSSSLVLSCFSPTESLELVYRVAGSQNMLGTQNKQAAQKLCRLLGFLPLAVAMAATYMRRCDVSCCEYLERYTTSQNSNNDHHRHPPQHTTQNSVSLAVASSLSISLHAIENENPIAARVLKWLSLLGPDQITKQLLRQLLKSAEEEEIKEDQETRNKKEQHRKAKSSSSTTVTLSLMASCGVIGLASISVTRPSQKQYSHLLPLLTTLSVCSIAIAAYSYQQSFWSNRDDEEEYPEIPMDKLRNGGLTKRLSTTFSPFEYEQSDSVWDILKSFSLLSVKEGKGSIHRLLAHSLRSSQSQHDELRGNLQICLRAMGAVWNFQPDVTDTWKQSLTVLEHVKSVVSHYLEYHSASATTAISSRNAKVDRYYAFLAGRLSKEAGVLSAMALNAFLEAESSLEVSLSLLDTNYDGRIPSHFQKARAEVLHELGRVFRYQGSYSKSEKYLSKSLRIYNSLKENSVSLNRHGGDRDDTVGKGIADTLHELGVLEVKKHNLDSAASYLQQSLDMRIRWSSDSNLARYNRAPNSSASLSLTESDEINAACAATLHQLAAVHVARKPPSLDKAKVLLQEALGLSRQIGQRAATLKQLARVTIRQGLINRAETYLEQALDLYLELYGDNKLHINVAGVKFQQGALALQREQFDQAWLHFSECLRIRRHVYAYARPVVAGSSEEKDDSIDNPTHLEVSCVLHELGRVAFALGRVAHALDMLNSERGILQRLEETSTQIEQLFQARLTNLTWLRKCAKEMGNEKEVLRLSEEKTAMKRRGQKVKDDRNRLHSDSVLLQRKAVQCRFLTRKYVLNRGKHRLVDRDELGSSLEELFEEISKSPPDPFRSKTIQFHSTILQWIDKPVKERRSPILEACDRMRYGRLGFPFPSIIFSLNYMLSCFLSNIVWIQRRAKSPWRAGERFD